MVSGGVETSLVYTPTIRTRPQRNKRTNSLGIFDDIENSFIIKEQFWLEIVDDRGRRPVVGKQVGQKVRGLSRPKENQLNTLNSTPKDVKKGN